MLDGLPGLGSLRESEGNTDTLGLFIMGNAQFALGSLRLWGLLQHEHRDVRRDDGAGT